MNTATRTDIPLRSASAGDPSIVVLGVGFMARRSPLDWLFALLAVAGGLGSLWRYADAMDIYDKGILIGTVPAAIALGWFWLNYAAWLHMRLMKGLRGTVAAWWALAGLAVTTFAFIGVNMFLSGLHSYGTL
jgi:hypothetical protein